MRRREDVNKQHVKEWPQIVAIVVASLTMFTNGILFGWTSPFIVKITKDKENYNISEREASYFTYIPAIIGIVLCVPLSNLTDVLGRKRTLLLITIPQVSYWILTAVSNHVYFFYAARVCAGLSDIFTYGCLPMYIGEVSTPKVRGTWGNVYTLSLYCGQLFISVIGNLFSVRETAYICILFPILFVTIFSFMPESPYFYIIKGEFEEAKNSLRRLRKKDDVEEEFLSMRADVERQISESGTWKDTLMIDSNRRAIGISIFLRVSQQLGGLSVFMFYAQYIFEKSGSDISSAVATITYTSIGLVLGLCAAYTVEKVGRKISYTSSAAACSVALLLQSAYFFIDQNYPGVSLATVNWIPVAAMLSYNVFSSLGLAVVPSLMLGELFSASIKAKALMSAVLVLNFLEFLSCGLFYVLSANVGFYCPFFLFAVCLVISSVLSVYFVPETKGKTLEEIQQYFKRN